MICIASCLEHTSHACGTGVLFNGMFPLRNPQFILPMAVPPPEVDDIEFHDPNCWASTGRPWPALPWPGWPKTATTYASSTKLWLGKNSD